MCSSCQYISILLFLKNITIHHSVINRLDKLSTDNTRKSSAVHGLLAILDRLVRTLSNMAYNCGILKEDITPTIMDILRKNYNNSPHTTFYRIFKRLITPNQMDRNKLLEDKLCYILTKHNSVVRNTKGYNITSPVRVMNETNTVEKLRHKLLPGILVVYANPRNGAILFLALRGLFFLINLNKF